MELEHETAKISVYRGAILLPIPVQYVVLVGTNIGTVRFNEREVALFRLAFEDHCELCDAVQRVHGNAGEAGLGPLASEPRKCRNAVGGLGKTLEERPERRTRCDTFPAPCSRSSTSKACSRRLLTMGCEGAL